MNDKSVRIELQLAPSAHVTAPLKEVAWSAVTDAGIAVDGWRPLPGEADPAEWRDRNIAQPSLFIFISADRDEEAVQFLTDRAVQFATALARIRTQWPALPLGIQVLSDDRHRWLGFEPAESPSGIERGLSLVSSGLSSAHDAWDGGKDAWVVL